MEKQISALYEPEMMLKFIEENFGTSAADAVKKQFAASIRNNRMTLLGRTDIKTLLQNYRKEAPPAG